MSTNKLRLALLAKKYAGKSFSREDQARLDILTERMRQSLVIVEQSDVEMIEAAAAEIQRSRVLVHKHSEVPK